MSTRSCNTTDEKLKPKRPVRADSLALILPSRGLWHSRMGATLLPELATHGPGWAYRHEGDWTWKPFLSHGEYMPDCHNLPIQEMIEYEFEHGFEFEWVWFVEDDIVLPPLTLQKMKTRIREQGAADSRVVGMAAQTYVRRLKNGERMLECTVLERDGFVGGTGLFCLLIRRQVLHHYRTPLFSTMNKFDKGRRHLFQTMGQDWAWQSSIRELGLRVLGPHDLVVDHLAVVKFHDSDSHKNKVEWNGPHDIRSFNDWYPKP